MKRPSSSTTLTAMNLPVLAPHSRVQQRVLEKAKKKKKKTRKQFQRVRKREGYLNERATLDYR